MTQVFFDYLDSSFNMLDERKCTNKYLIPEHCASSEQLCLASVSQYVARIR